MRGARESPSRSAGCCRPRRRASRRSTGRRRRRSRRLRCPGPAGAARDTARRWCPGTRRPGCGGSGGGSAPARRDAAATASGCAAAGRRNRTAFSLGQPLLVLAVELGGPAVGELAGSLARHLVGRQPRSFQRWMIADSTRGRPALVVDVLGLQQLLDQPRLVVGVEDGEVAASARPARHGGAASRTPIAWKVPSHMPSAAPPISAGDALAHLARRLVGEGDGQDLRRPGAAGDQEVGEPRGQHAGLAGAGAGQHQQRAVARGSTAWRCSSFSPSRWAVGATARRAGWGSVGTGSSVISNGSAGGAMQRHIAIGAPDAYL